MICDTCKKQTTCELYKACKPIPVKTCSGHEVRGKLTHFIKILPQYMDAVEDGLKTFEIRKNDRDYRVGDYVILQEWTPEKEYLGFEVLVEVTYVTDYEQKEGYVVFGFTKETIATQSGEPQEK